MHAAAADATATLDREALADLVEAIARRADRGAFAALFRHFAPKIKGYLIKLGADRGQAEELTQEVMLTVWRKAATFDRRQASVSTWLFTIARNRRIDAVRRRGARNSTRPTRCWCPTRRSRPTSASTPSTARPASPRDQDAAAGTSRPRARGLLSRQVAQPDRRGDEHAARHREVAFASGLRQTAQSHRRRGAKHERTLASSERRAACKPQRTASSRRRSAASSPPTRACARCAASAMNGIEAVGGAALETRTRRRRCARRARTRARRTRRHRAANAAAVHDSLQRMPSEVRDIVALRRRQDRLVHRRARASRFSI